MALNSLWDDEAFDQNDSEDMSCPAALGVPGAGADVAAQQAAPTVPDDLADDDDNSNEEPGSDDDDEDDEKSQNSHEHDIEAEYAQLGPPSDCPSRGASSNLVSASSVGPVTFAMDDDEDADEHVDDSLHLQDFRPPEAPEAPPEFSAEDLRLREALIELYSRYKPENVSNVNMIVDKYRGWAVVDLFAQLGSKYSIPPPEIVKHFLSEGLFEASAFEISDMSGASRVERAVASYRAMIGDCATPSSSSSYNPLSDEEQQSLLSKLFKDMENPGTLDLALGTLRFLTFRGLGAGSRKIRPKVWKLLSGMIKPSAVGRWDETEGEMRELYASYKSGILLVSNDAKPRFSVKVEPHQLMEAMKLLQQIQRDVERTRQDRALYRQSSTRATMISILFVYANINPDISYVQGMNEMLAAVIHALCGNNPATDDDASKDVVINEADVFWCFSFILSELKGDLKQSFEGGSSDPDPRLFLDSVLGIYDPQVAKHFAQLGCPIRSFIIRWCCLLFSQDLPLDDVVQLWDSFLAGPQRFRLATYMAVAGILSSRDELLALQDPGLLHELLATLPKTMDFGTWWRRGVSLLALEQRNLERQPAYPHRPGGAAAIINGSSVLTTTASWAKMAATRAQELGTGAASNVQQKVVPALRERVGKAKESQVAQQAVSATRGGFQAVKAWFEQDAPLQPEQVAKVADLWRRVSSKGKEAGAAASSSSPAGASAPASASASQTIPTAHSPSDESGPNDLEKKQAQPASIVADDGDGREVPAHALPSGETSNEKKQVAVVAGEADEDEEEDGVVY